MMRLYYKQSVSVTEWMSDIKDDAVREIVNYSWAQKRDSQLIFRLMKRHFVLYKKEYKKFRTKNSPDDRTWNGKMEICE